MTRSFLPTDFNIKAWGDLKPWMESLVEREINTIEDLKKWLKDQSEFEAVVSEDMAWRYIKMTINTADEEKVKDYQFFIQEISPKLAPYADQLNRKLTDHPLSKELSGKAFEIYFRKLKKELEMYREINIPLKSEIASKSQKFGEISGALGIDLNGEKVTLQKAALELKKTDRALRKEVYEKVLTERLSVKDDLDKLFDELISKRHQVAQNAGYDNFRDYMFDALGRFDYTKQDCFDFHNSIAKAVVPLNNAVAEKRKEKLDLELLAPYDTAVDVEGRDALKAFENVEELVEGSIVIFDKIDPYFGECLRTMKKGGFLDLESKKGKAPGGYNYPLYESGIPFIFMNSVGSPRDLVTMMHEGGHAVHSFLTDDLELVSFKSCPSEVAEFASMSMELFSMDHWDVFYKNEEDLKRAKREQLQDLLSTLPWVAIIDKFQHWIYENPKHTREERTQAWLKIEGELGNSVVNWSGYEKGLENAWQKQLHLYEVPFYYIEYGMAQLGAIAIWRNYKQDKKKAIENYKDALSLGYTKSIGEVYKTAGVEFNFSEEYITQLMTFVQNELDKL